MLNISKAVLFVSVLFLPVMTLAANRMVTEDMQKCSSNEECTLISESCDKACATLPVNKSYAPGVLEAMACPTPISTLPACTVNPPLSAACINNRCTLGSAWQTNGSDDDFKNKLAPKAVP